MKKTILFTLVVFLLVGCTHKDKVQNDSAPQVVLTEVTKVTGEGNLHYSGSIEAFQTIPLAFQTTGTVLKVLVNAGDAVRKGQLLATVDKADAMSMYEAANAKYKQAKDAYNRLKEVHDNGSLSEIKWVEMESNLQQAQSSAALAKNNLSKCALYAPDNGVIGRRNIEPGMSSLGNPVAPLELVKMMPVLGQKSLLFLKKP